MSDGYVLVTGASGYVGRFVAPMLAAEGLRVAGTYLSSPVMLDKVDTAPVDLTDERAVDRLFRDMRPVAVVHLAAATRMGWCQKHPAEAEAMIVTATGNLLAARAARTPAVPFLHLSTDLVFDGTGAPYPEDAPPKPISVYGSLKARAEEAVQADGQPGMVLRSALVYGPPRSGKGSFLSWMVEGARAGEPVTLFEDEWRTPVDVFSLAGAVSLLLLRGEAGAIYHAGGPERLSRWEMGNAVRSVFGLAENAFAPGRREDLDDAAIRPRDVSLRSQALHDLGWNPCPTFTQGLLKCRDSWDD